MKTLTLMKMKVNTQKNKCLCNRLANLKELTLFKGIVSSRSDVKCIESVSESETRKKRSATLAD